jgi:ornithine decarboxylase
MFKSQNRKTIKSLSILKKINNNKPYYIINTNVVQNQINIWNQHLKNIGIRYAIKCNNDIEIINKLIDNACGFDCASKNEIELILNCYDQRNIKPNKNNIIFANPVKKIDHLQYALDNGIFNMTFDSLSELEKINYFDKLKQSKLFLRLAVDDSYSLCQLNKKFGLDTNELDDVTNYVKNNKMNLIGLAFHVGSNCNNHQSYIDAFKKIVSVNDHLKNNNIIVDTIDVGGGFLANKSFGNVAMHINESIKKYFMNENIKFIAEPGRFIAEKTTILYTNIIGVKDKIDKMIYHIDESTYMGFNCVHNDHIENFKISILDENNKFIMKKNILLENTSVYETQLNGVTCDSIDIIYLKTKLPKLKVGYKLLISDFGAYTYAANSSFNGMESPQKIYNKYNIL